jgi:hypothetical protein
MALPINSTPIYNLTVPSSGKQIKYRPFLIKDEKALLIAQQSEDSTVMIDSLKQVIRSCTQFENQDQINVNDLATFDLEYVFTQIRAKSVGEIVELNLLCDTCTDEKAVTKVSIDLTTLQVEKDPKHQTKIKLFDNVGIALKYPTMELVKKLENADSNDIEQIFNIVLECIDYIYTDEEMFHAKDQTKQELLTFLNNLTSDQFKAIQEFFETMPQMKKNIDYSCPVCGKEHHKVLEGLASFF